MSLAYSSKEEFIRHIAAENQDSDLGRKILWSRHATVRLADYGLSRPQVEAALIHCVVIEDYPSVHRPLPDCLVLGYLSSGDPFHAVVALDIANDRLFMITVYIPTSERWKDDWQTRK